MTGTVIVLGEEGKEGDMSSHCGHTLSLPPPPENGGAGQLNYTLTKDNRQRENRY
jgi:hypothetical protein